MSCLVLQYCVNRNFEFSSLNICQNFYKKVLVNVHNISDELFATVEEYPFQVGLAALALRKLINYGY